MNHFLDIHKTNPSDLRSIIDQAAVMKSARDGRPRGAQDDVWHLGTAPMSGKLSWCLELVITAELASGPGRRRPPVVSHAGESGLSLTCGASPGEWTSGEHEN